MTLSSQRAPRQTIQPWWLNKLFVQISVFALKKNLASNVPFSNDRATRRRYILVLARDPSLQAGPSALRFQHAPLLERMVAGLGVSIRTVHAVRTLNRSQREASVTQVNAR